MSVKRLKKSLGLLDVFAISTGAMIASGFFILPGIAASKSGPAAILSYIIAGIMVIPTLFSLSELATAMPRSGGTYFFISRSLGPMFGTIDGLGDWLALVLKASIAVVGLGVYFSMFLGVNYIYIAIVFAVLFAIINLVGSREAGIFQVGMVLFLVGILGVFIARGIPRVTGGNYVPFAPFGFESVLSTAGLVFVSFIGLTGVASVSEEVKNPARNIPLGMILSLITVIIIYGLGVYAVIGTLPKEELYQSLTPISDSAGMFFGNAGVIAISIAALLAFATTGNAGLMAASRYLLAMGRDRIIPHRFARFSRRKTPKNAILFSTLVMIVIISLFDVESIAKLASTFQILVFAIINVAVLIMRESGLESYDPEFKSPLYPYMQIAGILVAVVLIPEMGFLSMLFTLILISAGVIWYNLRVRHKGIGVSAVSRAAERMTERLLENDARALGLDKELREILKEKGIRPEDPFAEMLRRAEFIEIDPCDDAECVLKEGAEILSEKSGISSDLIYGALLERNYLGETPAESGIALPHLLLEEVDDFYLVIARSVTGLEFPTSDQTIHAIFILLGSRDNPSRHLRFLAEIARRAEDPGFIDRWIKAKGMGELVDILLEKE